VRVGHGAVDAEAVQSQRVAVRVQRHVWILLGERERNGWWWVVEKGGDRRVIKLEVHDSGNGRVVVVGDDIVHVVVGLDGRVGVAK